MQISLKKGRDLQRLALAAANKYSLTSSVSISVYSGGENPREHVVTLFETGAAKAVSTVATALELIETGYAIRLLLSRANEETRDGQSINDLVGQRAMIEEQEKRLVSLTASLSTEYERNHHGEGIEEVVAQIGAHRAPGPTAELSRRTPFSGALTLSVIVEGQIEKWEDQIRDLRLRNAELTDRLGERNIGTRITLPPQVVTVLRAHKLLAA